MSTGNPLCDDHEPLACSENVVTDNTFDRSMHKAAHATFPDDESPSDDVFWLLEENARLRALAIRLSNLLGDLPEENVATRRPPHSGTERQGEQLSNPLTSQSSISYRTERKSGP